MLCLLLAACWHTAIAGEAALLPSNHTTENTITASSDPWSPVVGDTEGDQALSFRATDVPDGKNGRPGDFGLVENIRKQLMQDNYDYTSNESGETESPDVSVTTTARTTERTMSIRTTSSTPSNTTFHSFRATHLLSTTTTKSQIQMQMASVSMPLKSKKGKKNWPTDAAPRFRAFDKVSHSPATKMAKYAEHQIEVSKKDLLFYMDDSHFSRKNAGTIYRRKYDNSDVNITTSTNGNKHVINGKQKIDRRSQLYDSRSERKQTNEYDINQKIRRVRRINKAASNKDDLNDQNYVKYADDRSKTKYESGVDKKYDSQTIEYTENVHHNSYHNTRLHREDNAAFNNKNKIEKSYSYSDQSEESHNVQNNDAENVSAVNKNQPLKRKKNIKKISKTSHENDSEDTVHYQFPDRRTIRPMHKNFRRKNQLHKEKKKKHVLVSQPGKRHNTKLPRKNTTRRNRKQKMQMNKKMERMAYNFELFKKFKQQQRIQEQKRQQNRVRHKKKNLPIRKHRRKKVVRKKNFNRNNKYSRKHNTLGGLYRKSHEREDQTKANDVLENHIDKKHDKKSDTTVTTGNPSDIKEDQSQNSQSENDKNVDGKHDDIEHDELKKENHSDDLDDSLHDDMPHDDAPHDDTPHDDTPHDDTPHDDTPEDDTPHDDTPLDDTPLDDTPHDDTPHDDTPHDDTPHDDTPPDDTPHDDTPLDELKDEHNIDQKDQNDKKAYVDSIDNEELEGFNGRRMNNDDKNFTQVNKPHNQCNDSHQCSNHKNKIQNSQEDNQLKAETPQSAKKYKLLEVPVKGGSRRSNRGNRKIIQERDANGVALYAVDEGPFPQFRLPRDRRQYMDDHIDKRPPLLELAKKSSSGGDSGRHHNH